MRDLFMRLEQFAKSEATVLIQGETGTGKELVAQAIHEHSPRKGGPFVVVDCGAIQENLLESELFGHTRSAFSGATHDRDGAVLDADGGTLFLDEIGEIPLGMQSKLLRVIESRSVKRIGENKYTKVDVRFVCATHRNLREMVNLGTFREDLYFRIAVLSVLVPPLRERPEDIGILLKHFMPSPGAAGAMDRALAEELTSRRWEGNVRELRNVAQRAMAHGWREALDRLETPAAPPRLDDGGAANKGPRVGPANGLPAGLLEGSYAQAKRQMWEWWERAFVTELLTRHHGDAKKAAAEAVMSKSYLWKVMKRCGV